MSERIPKTRVQQRIEELKLAEQDAALRLHAIRVAIVELKALLAPAEPVITGEPLGAPQEA